MTSPAEFWIWDWGFRIWDFVVVFSPLKSQQNPKSEIPNPKSSAILDRSVARDNRN